MEKIIIIFRQLISIIIAVHLVSIVNGQSVGIGTISPDTSAMLEIKSTNKGFLIPRMTTVQRDAIVNPTIGLQIFNLDDSCSDTYNGSTWAKNCNLNEFGFVFTAANKWVRRADFAGIARSQAVAFSIGDKGYLGTGNSSTGYKKDFWEYSAVTNVWSQKADVGGAARISAVGFSIGSKGYIGTGIDATGYKKDFWEYNPNTNSWIQKADFGGTARYEAVGFSIDAMGYIGTGYDNAALSDFWQYNPISNAWVEKQPIDEARFSAIGFSANSKGYIGTGDTYFNLLGEFYEYDPVSNLWTFKTNLPAAATVEAVVVTKDNRAYICDGKNFWEYLPFTNVWTPRLDFGGVTRYGACGFAIGSNIYIGTGVSASGGYKKDFWEYNILPTVGKIYKEKTPTDVFAIATPTWTSDQNLTRPTSDGINVNINGPLTVSDATTVSGSIGLNANAGIRTKYSGTIVKTFTVGGLQFTNLTIPVLPTGWDFTNTLVLVSNADGILGAIHQAKLTSTTNIQVKFNANTAGSVRFSYIIFKL
jgi:hypothetical protein